MKKILLNVASILLAFGLNGQIENGMIAHFPFNGNHADISNNSIVGVNSGSTFGVDRNGIANNALELNGTQFYGFNDTAVKVSFPLTISAWVKIGSNSSSIFNQIFFSDNDYNNNAGYWLQVVGVTYQPALSFGGNLGSTGAGSRRSYVSDVNLQIGFWHHIVGIIRAHDDMDIYIDGIQSTGLYSGSGPTTIAYTSTESKIGASSGVAGNPQGSFFEGAIDQLAIWERELSVAEISLLSNPNTSLSIPEISKTPKTIVKIYNIMGQETEIVKNTPLIYLYSDGSRENIMILD